MIKKKVKKKNLATFYLFYNPEVLNQYKRDLISPLTLSNEDWNLINL